MQKLSVRFGPFKIFRGTRSKRQILQALLLFLVAISKTDSYREAISLYEKRQAYVHL